MAYGPVYYEMSYFVRGRPPTEAGKRVLQIRRTKRARSISAAAAPPRACGALGTVGV